MYKGFDGNFPALLGLDFRCEGDKYDIHNSHCLLICQSVNMFQFHKRLTYPKSLKADINAL